MVSNVAGTDGHPVSKFMELALGIAREAGELGEVPVGAVVVRSGIVIGSGGNRVEGEQDPAAHAEMLAIREAASILGSWRLLGCVLYSTLEPCPMCAGAILLARLSGCVYGCRDPKKGADGSIYDVLSAAGGNHHPFVVPDFLAEESSQLLSGFFRLQRRRG